MVVLSAHQKGIIVEVLKRLEWQRKNRNWVYSSSREHGYRAKVLGQMYVIMALFEWREEGEVWDAVGLEKPTAYPTTIVGGTEGPLSIRMTCAQDLW